MNKGDKRRSRRKYRVRYDRIVILVLALAVLIVLITSCSIAFWGKEKPESSQSGKSESSETSQPSEPAPTEPEQEQPTTTEPPAEPPLEGYQKLQMSNSEIYKGDLVLVNAQYEYKFPEGDIDPVTVYDHQNDYYSYGDMITSLDSSALVQLNNMIQAFASERGLYATDIFVQDGYRTYDEQVERHNSGRSKTFEAGHTDYHTGRTIDLFRIDSTSGSGFSYFSAEGDCQWFAENSGKYGFIVRYPQGKDEITGEKARSYTYRYVGAPHAGYINSNGLCLEEYIELLKQHTNESPLEISENGHSYGVYYVAAAEGDVTDVPVPADKSYTISGNNADGFIVTVTQS